MKLTTLECNRQIAASPEEVYDVWIDPESPGGPWFSPNNDKQQSKTILAAKVDGLFYHSVSVPAQNMVFTHYGRFTRMERGAVVEHTWVSEATQGRESVVTTTFTAVDGGTLVRLTHSGLPDDDHAKQRLAGWQWVLGALAQRLGKSR